MVAPFRSDIPVPIDEHTQDVMLVSAWIGDAVPDDVFISYTTLLLGLLFARVEPPWPWQVEAARTLRVDMILRSKKGLSRSIVENASQRAGASTDPRQKAWPEGRPLLSVSARNLLTGAFEAAIAGRGKDAVVTPADIMATFLHKVPPAHAKQAAAWGFTEAAPRIVKLLPGAPASAPPASDSLPGFDAAATHVLKLAFVLGGRRRGSRRRLLASETLLVALVDASPGLDEQDGAEARMLAGMLGYDGNADSDYAVRKADLYDLTGNPADDVAVMPPAFPPLSRNAQAILDDARDFATRLSRGSPIGVRHLVTALITERDGTDRASGAVTWLRDAALEMDKLREGLARIIAHRHPLDDHAGWRDLLLGSSVRLIARAEADTIPDDPRDQDSLDLRRYSDAIGALISARQQQPPLSIAVFGPWGSGKSFFMRMIRAAVQDFAAKGAPAAADGHGHFLQRIVQIEFNAWHYAEGNLWASLFHALLVGLESELRPAPDEHPFETLLNSLRLREAELHEAEKRLEEAGRRLAESQAAMREADQQAASRRADEANLPSVADVLRAVQEEALAQLGPPAGQADPAAWIASVGDSVGKAATYLGRPELADKLPSLTAAATDTAKATEALQTQVGAVRELLDEAKASAERGLGLLGWLAQTRVSAPSLLALALSGAALLAVLVCLAVFLESRGSEVAALVTGVAAVLAPLAGAAGAAIAWAKRHLADASRAFAVLGSIRDRVEARQAQKLGEHEARLLAARRATSEAEAEAARRRADFQAAQAAVDKAREELRQSVSAERLKRFVAQRLAEGDYQRHLGLIHTIRTDLQQLETILTKVHPKEKDHATQPPVERIVLYIDDLDRCPPARVVEVLEAVHLLLAFKLFVVVVGVDVRWVSQALRKRYPAQLGDAPGVASPLDYLEKVFQIPFWLPAMDAGGGRRLLDKAVGPAALTGTPRRIQGGSPPRVTNGAGSAGSDAGGTAETATAPAAGAAPPAAAAAAAAGQGASATADIAAAAEALELGRQERDRLLDMAEAIGASPRRAKRFANLYRLLKASLSREERRGFVLDGGRAGSYDAALMLLAIATGAPRAATALIAEFAEEPAGNAAAYVDERFARVAAAVLPAESAAFTAARQMVAKVKDQNAIAGHLRFWAPRVLRFAFDGQTAPRMAPPVSDPAAPAPRQRKPRTKSMPGAEGPAPQPDSQGMEPPSRPA